MSHTIHIHSFGFNDRSGKIRWLANELGLNIEEHKVELGAHRKDDYRQLNPFAAIPTIEFNNQTLIESTATCIYLAEQFPEHNLAIFSKDPSRYHYLKWISIFSESLESRLVDYILANAGLVSKDIQPIYEKALRFKLRIVAEQLPESGFILGEQFTVADIIAGYSLKIAILCDLIDWEAVKHYMHPLMERDAANQAHFFDGLKKHLE